MFKVLFTLVELVEFMVHLVQKLKELVGIGSLKARDEELDILRLYWK
jgi:hypothetical protein